MKIKIRYSSILSLEDNSIVPVELDLDLFRETVQCNRLIVDDRRRVF